MYLYRLATLLFVAFCAGGSAAQIPTAEQIARMLVMDLSPTRAIESGEWFTNSNETYALGIIYVHVPGSAGTVSIHGGIYGFLDSGWAKLADVTGLYGFSPMNARFDQTGVTLSTLTLAPGDPRCCPTKNTIWRIGFADGVAVPLN